MDKSNAGQGYVKCGNQLLLFNYIIRDVNTIAVLHRNGYFVHPDIGPWHKIEPPVSWNEQTTLRDGSIIETNGTLLSVVKDTIGEARA